MIAALKRFFRRLRYGKTIVEPEAVKRLRPIEGAIGAFRDNAGQIVYTSCPRKFSHRYEGQKIGYYPPVRTEDERDPLLDTVVGIAEAAVVAEVVSDLFGGTSDTSTPDASSDDYTSGGGNFGGGGASGDW